MKRKPHPSNKHSHKPEQKPPSGVATLRDHFTLCILPLTVVKQLQQGSVSMPSMRLKLPTAFALLAAATLLNANRSYQVNALPASSQASVLTPHTAIASGISHQLDNVAC